MRVGGEQHLIDSVFIYRRHCCAGSRRTCFVFSSIHFLYIGIQ